MPAIPPPTTNAALFTGKIKFLQWLKWHARATDIRMISFAFCVASSFSLEWTQEQCSLIFAIS
jgi:hypothetical protein